MANKRKLIGGATRCENLPAAEFIAGQVDLLSEILFRVPVKPLLRFKCVSKQWLLLLSESQFTYSHARRNNPNFSNGVMYFNCSKQGNAKKVKSVSVNGQRTPRPTLDFLRQVGVKSESAPRMVDSCNGLLLCEQTKMNTKVYIVCNPTTQKFTVLPEPEFGHGDQTVLGKSACLAFDPSTSPDYKVIILVGGFPAGFLNIDIYSSESTCWKKMCVPIPPDSPGPPGYSKGMVFWNRVIHLMTSHLVHIQWDIDDDAGSTGALLPLPEQIPHEFILYFGECHGRLLLVLGEGLIRSQLKMKILEMDNEMSGGWVVKHQLNLKLSRTMFSETLLRRFFLLFVTQLGANEEDLTLVLSFPSKFVSYNLKSKTWKVLFDLPIYKKREVIYNYGQAYQFIESLAPV